MVNALKNLPKPLFGTYLSLLLLSHWGRRKLQGDYIHIYATESFCLKFREHEMCVWQLWFIIFKSGRKSELGEGLLVYREAGPGE